LIDASPSTGDVTLTAPAQAGITINAVKATGSTTITANGNGTVISQAATGTGAVTITSANGVGNVITLGDGANTITAANGNGTSITVGTGANSITAAGDGTVINIGSAKVAQAGPVSVTANGAGASITVKSLLTTPTAQSLAITATGSGDTVDLSGYASNASASVTVGNNSTVKIGAGSVGNVLNVTVGTKANVTFFGGYANLDVSGATAGSTSSGSYKLTTVNTVLSTDKITLVNRGTEVFNSAPVDVSSATTVGAALDLASASIDPTHSNISWFQYGGDTYLVEDNSTSAALASGDVVVKFVGAVDLSSLTGAGNVLTF
jgi:S-layer protein